MSTTYKQVPASWGGTTFTYGRTSLPSCWYLPGFWLSAIQLQVTPKIPRNDVKHLHTSCRGIPLPLGPANLLKSVRASAATQHKCSTLHLRTWLLLKTPLMCYTVRNLSLVSRDWTLVNASRCLQSLLHGFTFSLCGKSYFSPPILHALTCKSQPEHWHLQARVRAFGIFFTS